MVNISLPRGMRDFTTIEAIQRREIIGVIEEVFKRFGFSPIETPSIENLDVLNAKVYGEEPQKEIFKIEGEDAALRYDLTVPLARFVAMNKDLPLPFKRYQIGNVWRKDEPQRMRYREFMQADIDIVGSSEITSDAEVMGAASVALDMLGIRGYKILINDRRVLSRILEYFGVPKEKEREVIRLIDKLQKIGSEEVTKQISSLGISEEKAEALIEFLIKEESNEEKIERLRANIGLENELNQMEKLIGLVSRYKTSGEVIFDLSLARGLDYYTSFVWEFVYYEEGKRLPTITAGGRYDNLIGIFSNEQIPATGISIGIDRLMSIIESNERRSYSRVYIAYIGDTVDYALYIANALREAGIYTDFNVTKRSLAKQLEYANAMKIKYTVIIGEEEQKGNKLKLRDMITGREELLSLEEAIEVIKGSE